MPGSHAVLSPSAADRWIQCPASVRMAQTVGKGDESSYAAEGTAAHALAEIKARNEIKKGLRQEDYAREVVEWRKEYSIDGETFDEMRKHCNDYVALLRDRLQAYPNSILMLEERMDTGVPNCWGTGDAVIVSPAHVEVIDLKYGQGIPVDAEGNPQLRLYGLGALDNYGELLGDVEIIRTTVFQPRLDNISTEELTVAELRYWRDSVVLPRAEEALSDDAQFGPSESACRWCPARGQCRAQLEAATQQDFGKNPDLLDPTEIAEALEDVGMIRNWINSLEETALTLAYSEDTDIPGWKVVSSGSRRYIGDQEGAIDALKQVGYGVEDVSTRKLNGIGALEKLLGKQEFSSVLDTFVEKTGGKPSLVPVSDKRQAIDPNNEAQKEFE